jgi:hypothetical protein
MGLKNLKGSCACGAVEFEAALPHDRAVLCHCLYYQRRTGSAFGVMVYFQSQHVSFPKTLLKSYSYKTDSGNMMQSHFCEMCGTSLFLTGDILSGIIGVAGGCFDDGYWFEIDREVFLRSKAHFICNIDANESMTTSPRYNPKKT